MLKSARMYFSGSTQYGAPLRIVLAALIALSAGTNANGQAGLCSPVAVPGAVLTTAEGVNSAGVVVGSYMTSDSMHGYIYSGGQFTTLDAPDSRATQAFGINDAGVVVGTYYPATPICNCIDDIEVHGFRYSGGQFTTIDVGLSQTWPMAINNVGQIVGFYNDRDGDIEDAKRGFLLSAGGAVTHIDGPDDGPLTEADTIVRGINDDGVAVGFYGGIAIDGGTVGGWGRGFTWRNGAMTELRHPEAQENSPLYGINNAETIVGIYAVPDGSNGGNFRFAGNRFSRFDCTEDEPEPSAGGFSLGAAPPNTAAAGASPQSGNAGSGTTSVTGLNNQGTIFGNRFINGVVKGFYTRPITFVDPIPDLAPPGDTKVTSDVVALATRGRVVQAIAADGVSQVVVRIPVASAGEVVTVTVYQSRTQEAGGETSAYGTVGTPGMVCPGPGCEASHVDVTATLSGSQGAMAFALYRAPLDFARSADDADLMYRDVYLHVQGSSGSTTISLRVIRPPVALVHGFWSDPSMWKSFAPYANRDPRFAFIPVNYGTPIRSRLIDMEPYYISWFGAKSSALGVEFNAKSVFPQIYVDIDNFKNGKNPVGLAAAAIQADFVAHSMGGLITRYLSLVPGFQRYTMGHGVVHKLITIDTPHLGSPLATRFIQQVDGGVSNQGCFRAILALPGNLVVKRAWLKMEPGSGMVNGAALDLMDTPSDVVWRIAQSNMRAIPTALIAAIYDDWWSLAPPPAGAIRALCVGDHVAEALTPTGWPALMGGSSDAMVTLHSQQAGIASVPWFPRMAHSSALFPLGFVPAYVTSHPSVAEVVIDRLNTPFTTQSRYVCLPQGQPCGQ